MAAKQATPTDINDTQMIDTKFETFKHVHVQFDLCFDCYSNKKRKCYHFS